MVEMKEYICKKCNHKWISRIKTEPVRCPRCKRADWNNRILSGANLQINSEVRAK